MNEKKLKKIKLYVMALVAILLTIFAIVHYLMDKNNFKKQTQINKKELLEHIEYTYNKEMRVINKNLNMHIEYLSKDKVMASMNNKASIKMINMHYKMIKTLIPSVQYIAIYDKNLNLTYANKKHNIQNRKDRNILKQALIQDDKVAHMLEKGYIDNNKVFLSYAIKIQKDDMTTRIIEINVDMSYLKNYIIDVNTQHDMKSHNSTFNLSLWNNKVGYNHLLEKNIQILNYKSLLLFDYRASMMPFLAMILIVTLINLLFTYFMKNFKKVEQKLKNDINQQPNLMVIFTKDEIINSNQAFIDTLDFKNQEDLISNHKYISDFFIPQDEFKISTMKDISWADYIMENKENNIHEVFLKNKYANKVDIFDILLNTYISDDDSKKYYIASFHNARTRYINRTNLYLEKSKNQTIIDNSMDGFIDWDTYRGEIFVSKRLKEILGYDEKEILNSVNLFLALIKMEHKQTFLQTVEDCFHQKDNFIQSEIQLLHKNKKYIWVIFRIKALESKDSDKATRFILFFTDITNQKMQEEAMENKIEKLKKIKD